MQQRSQTRFRPGILHLSMVSHQNIPAVLMQGRGTSTMATDVPIVNNSSNAVFWLNSRRHIALRENVWAFLTYPQIAVCGIEDFCAICPVHTKHDAL